MPWLQNYEDLRLGIEALLVPNPDRSSGRLVFKISVGSEAKGRSKKVLETQSNCCIITT